MGQETLIEGLNFAQKYELTTKEIEALVPFLKNPLTAEQLAKVLGGKNVTTMYHVIQRLKLKGLLILQERDKKGTNLYQFNFQSLEI